MYTLSTASKLHHRHFCRQPRNHEHVVQTEKGLYLKQPQVDELPQQVCPVGRGGVPGQATQLLQEFDQIIPPFCLHSQQDILTQSFNQPINQSTNQPTNQFTFLVFGTHQGSQQTIIGKTSFELHHDKYIVRSEIIQHSNVQKDMISHSTMIQNVI